MNFAIIFGLFFAFGVMLIASSLRKRRGPNFGERIAPQMRSVSIRESLHRENQASGTSVLDALYSFLEPMMQSFLGRVRSTESRDEALAARLRRAGIDQTVSAFRAEQILWAVSSVALLGVLSVIGLLENQLSLWSGLMLIILGGVTGFLARDWWLGQIIVRREKQLIAEFPALAEMMALSVAAGESALASLERICRTSRGELAREFNDILAQTRAGSSLLVALNEFAQSTQIPALSRFVDGVAVAIERGTPLADVLRAQAQDVRDNAKRELLEVAGKKEIAMLAPVVFLILPLTVVFAIFPGLSLMKLAF